MRLGFRISLTLLVSLAVVLSVGVLLLYGLPTIQRRVAEHARKVTLAQAAATADAITGNTGGQWHAMLSEKKNASHLPARPNRLLHRTINLYARPGETKVLVVNRAGNVVASEGKADFEAPATLVRTAASGKRLFQEIEGYDVAVTPIFYRDRLEGGVVLATGGFESTFDQILLRSSLEAALISLIASGGVALLLATVMGRRVERLALGARSIAGGDLSYRLVPDHGDELGELARTFNEMADRLEESFETLRRGEENLRTILDNLSEGVLAATSDGKITFANRAARRVLDTDAGTVPDPWEDFDLREAIARCAGSEERIEAMVQDGETFMRVNVVHISGFYGDGGGALVVMQDLSEGRRLEVNQQRFIANAAHTLKTPITTIVGAAELLLSGDDEDPTVRRRLLNHIFNESRKMQQLSDTLLRMARTGFEADRPKLRRTDLEETARSVLSQISPLAERMGIDLTLTGEAEPVLADAERLEHSLLILLQNAIKHSSRGDVVTLRLRGRSVSVEDEGEGIRDEDLPHVFERFYRGSGNTEGFGLGLSICKENVEAMGGRIEISSEQNRGTVVTLSLPPP